jgi:hypothetical protein
MRQQGICWSSTHRRLHTQLLGVRQGVVVNAWTLPGMGAQTAMRVCDI